jgi:hypothetical protein
MSKIKVGVLGATDHAGRATLCGADHPCFELTVLAAPKREQEGKLRLSLGALFF